jgi:hypothetical protein
MHLAGIALSIARISIDIGLVLASEGLDNIVDQNFILVGLLLTGLLEPHALLMFQRLIAPIKMATSRHGIRPSRTLRLIDFSSCPSILGKHLISQLISTNTYINRAHVISCHFCSGPFRP